MISRRSFLAIGATVLALALGATACSKSSSSTSPNGLQETNGTVSRANTGVIESTDQPRLGGKLVYALNAETNGWNPATNQWAPAGLQVTSALFDTIAAYDESSQIKPLLAESIDHNADFTQWTVRLRPNVKLHNGKPANADVVIRNQTYLAKSPVTGPAYRYSGATGFTKQDDLTVVVQLSKPSVVWPTLLATQLGVVADPDWLESNDGLKPIGTGPFSMVSWEIDKKLTVAKNPDYWRVDQRGIRLPYLDNIEFRPIADNESRGKALQAKDVDVIQTLAGQQLQAFQQRDNFQVYSDSKGESRELFVQLNTATEPFNDPDARRALAYATDKGAYSGLVSASFDEAANGPIAPNSPWYAKTDYPQFDPAKAKELVAKVKASHGGKFEFRLQGAAESDSTLGAQALQQQWAEVGIEAKIDMQEQAKMIIEVITGSFQSVMWGQFDAPNPLADGVWWDAKGAVAPPELTLNFARNKDQAISDALVAAGMERDATKRMVIFQTVQQRLATDLPYIWLVHQRVALIASTRVVNLVRDVLPDGSVALDMQQGAHHLAQIWLKD